MTSYTRTDNGHTMTVHAPAAGAFEATTRAAFEAFTAGEQILGLDVETTAINDRGPRHFHTGFAVRLVQFGTETTAWVLDSTDPDQRNAIEATLTDPARRFVSHTNYDPLSVWAAFGIPLGQRVLDTHLISKLIDPDEHAGHGLKELTTRHLDDGLTLAQEALHDRMRALAPVGHRAGHTWQTWGWNHMPADDAAYVVYAGLDAVYVRRLLPVLLEMCGPYAHLVAREAWLAAQSTGITIRGLLLDRPYALALLADLQTEHRTAETQITTALGCPGASPRFAQWLGGQTTKAGITGLPRTDKGRLQVTAETLTALRTDHANALPADVLALVNARLVMARTSNLIGNLRGFLDHADAEGRVHPQINTLRAKTARMSVTGPALQTLKKHDPRLRHAFRADPGHVLISCDFSQVEVRVAAALSEDPTLKQVIASGVDIHDATAELMYGEGFTPEQRTISKRCTFGTLYGGGARALAAQTGVTEAIARQVIDRWRHTYPQVITYGRRLADLSEVITPSGRRIPADPTRGYANSNYIVQSTARDLLLAAVYTLVTRHHLTGLWLFVHDEVIVQTPTADAERVRALLEQAMTATFRGVPIVAEAEILGTHWGKLSEVSADDEASQKRQETSDVNHVPAAAEPHRRQVVNVAGRTEPVAARLPIPERPENGGLLNAALTYAARGWRVFPIRPDAKKPPAVTDWENRATTDPEMIHLAWDRAPYNIGIACGPSGLVVIDLDLPKPGEHPPTRWADEPGVYDGADVLAALCEAEDQPFPFDTHHVRTPSGGIHLYFTAPTTVELHNTGKKLGWCIDTRAHGGYVVAPPSTVHGRPYTLVYDTTPAPLPGWLTRRLIAPRPDPHLQDARQLAMRELAHTGGTKATAYAGAALKGEIQRVLDAAPGTRNNTLNGAARRLGRLAAAGMLPRHLAEHALQTAGEAIGLTLGETAATIRSGLDYGMRPAEGTTA